MVTKSINFDVPQFLTTVRFTWMPDNGDTRNKPPALIQCIAYVMYSAEVAMYKVGDRTWAGLLPNGASASATAVLTCAGINFPSLRLTQIGDVTNDLSDGTDIAKKFVTIPTAGLTVVDYPIDTVINLRANYSGPAKDQPANNPTPWLNVTSSVDFNIDVELSGLALTSPSSAVFPTTGMTGNQYIFSAARPGTLNNPIWTAQLLGDTKPASAYVGVTTFDSFKINGSARGQSNVTAFGNTLNQKFNYTGLPADNSEFGNKQVSVKIADDVYKMDGANVQIFFDSSASN